MADPTLSPAPAPTREAVVFRDTLLMTAVWVRWLETFQTDTQRRLAAIEARLEALENP